MSARRWLAAAALVSANVSGCYVGPAVETFPPAHGPAGTVVVVEVGDTELRSEVLAVSDSGLLAVYQNQVALLPWTAIDFLNVPDLGATFRPRLDGLDREWRDAIRAIARFPQGVSLDIERRLLAHYRQEAVLLIKR